MISPLAQEIIDAHGGLERWRQFDTAAADLVQGGVLWALKGQAGVLDRTRVTVGLREEQASHAPFGSGARRSRFTPAEVTLEDADGQVLERLEQPRASFQGHQLDTPWTELQLAYFAGCAMWTYLNMPFLLAAPDVVSEELAPWEEAGESWRRLRVTLPPAIVSHSPVQTLYVAADGLLRRHDYDVEIAGNTPGAHYIEDYAEVSGIRMPTRRRIFPRQPDGIALKEPLVVSIDLSNIELR